MGAFLQDVRFALRMFRRSPGFSALAVLTLAAGIGADTAIFSVVAALLLRQMPYRDPAGLVLLDAERPAENIHQGPLTWVRFQQVRDRSRSFDGIAAVTSETFNLTGRGEPEQLAAARVSWNFFRILGVALPLGRGFLPEEDRTGSAPAAIISDSLWQRRFGRSRAALGAALTLDTHDYTIVGVAPPGFEFAVPLGPGIDVFATHPDELNGVTPQMVQSGVGYLWYVARLKPGVAIPAAQAEMNVLAAAWRRDNPKMPDADPALVVHAGNLRDEVVSGVRTAVLVLFGAVSLVLLIACANVASLLLSRAIGRRREIAVRCAIGATRGALIRQLLVESLRGGRYFSDHDTPEGMQVAIVDDRFARRFWPHDNPVGKHVWFDPKKPITIVGIVGTVKQYGLDDEGKIAVYFPHRQAPGGGMYLVARTPSDPALLASAIAGKIHSADPTAAVYEVRTMRDRLYGSLARERFSAAMLGAFALFAMILAAIGVYGVMSYLVAQSARDIGVRMALGAQRADILGMVLRQGIELAALGIALGLAGAVALTRLMAGLLFGIGARDPLTYLVVALALAAITMLATYVPARRATGIDPIVALREE